MCPSFVATAVRIITVEHVFVFEDVPNLQTVKINYIYSSFSYHAADISDVSEIAPGRLQHDFWTAINTGLSVVYVLLISRNRRTKVTENYLALVIQEIKPSRGINWSAVDTLAWRWGFHFFYNERFQNRSVFHFN
jgi:hypothetical protein